MNEKAVIVLGLYCYLVWWIVSAVIIEEGVPDGARFTWLGALVLFPRVVVAEAGIRIIAEAKKVIPPLWVEEGGGSGE